MSPRSAAELKAREYHGRSLGSSSRSRSSSAPEPALVSWQAMRSPPAALLGLVLIAACGGAKPAPTAPEDTPPASSSAAPPPETPEWDVAVKGASGKPAEC